MRKITFIGAGSAVFTKNLVNDLLHFEELRECTLSLMDIDAQRLERITRLVRRLVGDIGAPTTVESTTDRRAALDGADYVITEIQTGGWRASIPDIEIPLEYGVDQCIADTMGPGGVFKGLRTFPPLLEICRDMEEVCPDAILLNYANPMAILCWALSEATDVPVVGLCHSVPNTARELADKLDLPYEEVDYWVAGINHLAWFLRFERRGEDLYPALRALVETDALPQWDKVRMEMMRRTGYFVTESSGHFSEYVPYFRKRKELLETYGGPGYDGESKYYLKLSEIAQEFDESSVTAQLESEAPLELTPHSGEFASGIIRAMETDRPYRFNGNVPNTGLIANLPEGSCVEVPCYVDRMGIHPAHVGYLPSHLAALCQSNVTVQGLAVEGMLNGDRDLIYQAILHDPLTAAVCSPKEIKEITDRLFEANAEYLVGI